VSNNLEFVNSIQQRSKEEETEGQPHEPMEFEELEHILAMEEEEALDHFLN
jgi:hypothetical protein